MSCSELSESVTRAGSRSRILRLIGVGALALAMLFVAAPAPGADRARPLSSPLQISRSVSFDVDSGRSTALDVMAEASGVSAQAITPQIGLGSVSFRETTSGGVEIDGLMFNYGSVPASFPEIVMTEYAADGTWLREWSWMGTGEFIGAFTLYPGDICGFNHRIQLGDDVASVSIRPRGVYAERMPIYLPTDVEVTSWSDSSRSYRITVLNDTAYPSEHRYITLLEYSKSTGEVIDVLGDGDSTLLAPGETFVFNVTAPTDHGTSDVDWGAWAVMTKHDAETTGFARLGGVDRYETAAMASAAAFPADSVECVVIASGMSFADALSASALAGQLGSPVLLTKPASIPGVVLDEIDRLGARDVIVVGGETAVSSVVASQLASHVGTQTVQRVAGQTRYETSADVCAMVSDLHGAPLSSAFVARGDQFPDAMSAAPYAFSQVMPVLLVKPQWAAGSIVSAAADAGVENLYVLGGEAAVSDAVAESFATDWVRIQGSDRYWTSANIVMTAEENGWTDMGHVGLGVGTAYPDALAAGPCLGAQGGALLLTRGDLLSWAPGTALIHGADRVEHFTTYGGKAAVSDLTQGIARNLCF